LLWDIPATDQSFGHAPRRRRGSISDLPVPKSLSQHCCLGAFDGAMSIAMQKISFACMDRPLLLPSWPMLCSPCVSSSHRHGYVAFVDQHVSSLTRITGILVSLLRRIATQFIHVGDEGKLDLRTPGRYNRV